MHIQSEHTLNKNNVLLNKISTCFWQLLHSKLKTKVLTCGPLMFPCALFSVANSQENTQSNGIYNEYKTNEYGTSLSKFNKILKKMRWKIMRQLEASF